MKRLLIILYIRRANIYKDERARPNRAIVSIGAEEALAYRDTTLRTSSPRVRYGKI